MRTWCLEAISHYNFECVCVLFIQSMPLFEFVCVNWMFVQFLKEVINFKGAVCV